MFCLYEDNEEIVRLLPYKVKELQATYPNFTGATANKYDDDDTLDIEGKYLTKDEVSGLLLVLVDMFDLDWDKVTRTVNGEY